MTPRIFIIDLDGPLLEGKQRHYQCYADILRVRGLQPIAIDRYWAGKRARMDRRKLLELSDASSLYEEFKNAWLQNIEKKEYLALDRLQDGAVDTLQIWKEQGMTLILATMRNDPVNLRWQLHRLHLDSLFDDVVAVGPGHGAGGKADAVRALLGEAEADSAVWIGDTEVDIEAARALNIKVCALTCGLRSEEVLAGMHPDMLEPDLSTFARRRLGPAR